MTTSSKPAADKSEVAIEKEVQEKVDTETSQGFFGTKTDPLPNEAYSLESGPDSPGVVEARKAFLDAEHANADKK